MLEEAFACGLELEPHLLEAMTPDATDRQHNERRGIYRAREALVRDVAGPVHASVKERWDVDAHGYRKKSKALRRLLESVDGSWDRIEIVQ
jgi:hypothetical protein